MSSTFMILTALRGVNKHKCKYFFLKKFMVDKKDVAFDIILFIQRFDCRIINFTASARQQ